MTQGLSFDYVTPPNSVTMLEIADRNHRYMLSVFYQCHSLPFDKDGESDATTNLVPIQWLHERADLPHDYLKLAFLNHCLNLLRRPEANVLHFAHDFGKELGTKKHTTVEWEFPIPYWPEWEFVDDTDRAEFSVHVLVTTNGTLQVEEVLQRAQKAIRLLLRPVYFSSAQEWTLSGVGVIEGLLERLQSATIATSLDDLPFGDLFPELKEYFTAASPPEKDKDMKFLNFIFKGKGRHPQEKMVFAIEGLILSGNWKLLRILIDSFVQANIKRCLIDSTLVATDTMWLLLRDTLRVVWRLCHPSLRDVTAQVISFCTTCVLAATGGEWPIFSHEDENEERRVYHSWASLKIPILPFGQVDGDINEHVATTLHFVNLTEWLDWDTYQWLATFCKIERFWNGSGAATNHYVVENHDRIKWVAETLAKRANENRSYTVPTDGLVVDIPSEFVREQLGLTKLLLHETSPGQLLFVALDDNERGIVGKWTIEQPALVQHFPAPFTDTPPEVAVILAACIAAVYHDVVVMADDVFNTVVAESKRPSRKHDQNQPVNGKRPTVKTTNLKGRLRHVRYKQSTIAAGQERRQRVQHGVVGHLRRLPNGWRTPPERLDDVRQAADAHHIYIPPGYTFVVPHLRGGEKAQDHRLTRFVGLHRLESLNINNMPAAKE